MSNDFYLIIDSQTFKLYYQVIKINSMGNGQPTKDTGTPSPHNTAQVALKKLNRVTVIGRGGFGKVWKVEVKKTRKLFAMKEMSKAKILMKKSVQSVMNELQLLKCLKHQFLINAVMAFQDRQNLYMVMDLLCGGDLRFHLIKHSRFNQQHTKFFAACIVVALQFLHINGILHRDLKPQNLVFDKKGYLRLTDLGVARIWKPENLSDTSGTPGYMGNQSIYQAPEVMCRCNHGIAIDYYALGIIVYECMFGIRPYVGQTRQDIRDKILAKQAVVKKNQIPFGWSQQAADFVNQTIQRKPQNRLGNHGPQEVMAHPWFNDMDWQKLKSKKLQSPFVPIYRPEQYQDQLAALQDPPIAPETLLLLRKQAIQNVFSQYFYDGENMENPLLEHAIY